LVIFDLDGTLVDSLGDIAFAANAALAAHALPTYPTGRYREFVGWGLRRLVELAAPGDEPLWPRVEATFRAHYGVDRSRVYDGVPELLVELAAAGIGAAVLSNKPEGFTGRVVDALLGDHSWVAVYGQRDDRPAKPDPTALLEICELAGVDPTGAVMVGDSEVDIATARAAGVRSIAARWGFGRALDDADVVVDHVGDLRTALF
jgi:phosphoglycolate phosphatase